MTKTNGGLWSSKIFFETKEKSEATRAKKKCDVEQSHIVMCVGSKAFHSSFDDD